MEQFFTNETNDFLLRSSRTQCAIVFTNMEQNTVKTIFLVLVFQANIAIGFVWILAAFFAACPLLGWSNYVSEVRFIWLPLSYNFLKAHSHLSKNGVCTIHIYPRLYLLHYPYKAEHMEIYLLSTRIIFGTTGGQFCERHQTIGHTGYYKV